MRNRQKSRQNVFYDSPNNRIKIVKQAKLVTWLCLMYVFFVQI